MPSDAEIINEINWIRRKAKDLAQSLSDPQQKAEADRIRRKAGDLDQVLRQRLRQK